ncbi:MAG TPA: CPBP family intramembrane glutamic endopeptidase [Streptosporangiaceae bacterium]
MSEQSEADAGGRRGPTKPEWTYQVPVDIQLPSIDPRSRRSLVLETWFIQIAFLVPAITGAVDALAAHLGGTGTIHRIPTIVTGHPLTNFFVTTASYFEVAAVVPIALLLLNRTGQTPAALGLVKQWWFRDIWPAIGLGVAGFGTELIMLIALAPAISNDKSLFVSPSLGPLPKYYVIYGILISATTAIAEETLVNGYLLVRLDQFGWDRNWALVLSMTLRTSYHIYYGLGFLLTIPLGFYNTRSFQKNGRLTRPILAHFLYDAVLFTVAVLHH